MTTEKNDPWALLREARDFMRQAAISRGPCPDCTECDRRDAIVAKADAALAAHDAVAPSEEEPDVKWHTAMSYGCDCDNEDEHDHFFLSGKVGAVAVSVYPEKARDGAIPWCAALIHAKEDAAPTLDEAKAAAIAAARGMR